MPIKPARIAWKHRRQGAVAAELPIRRCAREDIPRACLERLDRLAAPLVDAGLVHALDVGPTDEHAAITNHACVLAHPTERLRAWVIDITGAHSVTTYVELATRFADGGAVVTLNPDAPAIFDKPPWLRETRLPGAAVPELIAAHRRAVAASGSTPIAPWDDDPLVTAQAENAAVLAYQKECGILRGGDGDDAFGYTARGAARSVFRVWRAMK